MKRPLHILHADDDIEDRWIFRDGLMECDPDIRLTQFEDGTQLLRYMETVTPDQHTTYAIICDMQMPVVNGLDVLQTVRVIPVWSKAPVIMFSTSSLLEDIRNCIGKGALAFYSKPTTFQESRSIIKEIIDACTKERTAS